jgi:hypothetical protein
MHLAFSTTVLAPLSPTTTRRTAPHHNIAQWGVRPDVCLQARSSVRPRTICSQTESLQGLTNSSVRLVISVQSLTKYGPSVRYISYVGPDNTSASVKTLDAWKERLAPQITQIAISPVKTAVHYANVLSRGLDTETVYRKFDDPIDEECARTCPRRAISNIDWRVIRSSEEDV